VTASIFSKYCIGILVKLIEFKVVVTELNLKCMIVGLGEGKGGVEV
jgi:hypothetical protein